MDEEHILFIYREAPHCTCLELDKRFKLIGVRNRRDFDFTTPDSCRDSLRSI